MPTAESQHLDELRHLIETRDLSLLSRRLLDYCQMIEAPPALRQKAIQLRAAYNSRLNGDQESEALMLGEAIELTDAIEAMPGLNFQSGGSASSSNEEDLIFKGRKIRKKFSTPGHTFELESLDLDLRSGEITGIVGENGNGKTTLLRIVAGDLRPDSGDVRYPGFGFAPEDWLDIRHQVAFIPQSLTPWNGLLKENLHFAAATHGILGSENEDQVDFVIHRLGLSAYQEAYWSEISSGYRLRFELARALVWRPRLLVIDEPLANLDVHAQKIFLQDLRFLAESKRYPMAVLISSQHLHELETVADNILFLRQGKVLYNGQMDRFGQKRPENLFELKTPLERRILSARLNHIPAIKVEDRGTHLLLRCPVELSAAEVLQHLISSEVEVIYFRDISRSTLKLFFDQ